MTPCKNTKHSLANESLASDKKQENPRIRCEMVRTNVFIVEQSYNRVTIYFKVMQ